MPSESRRGFLKLSAGAALAGGLLPQSIARALAIPAARRSGTIADVEHIVVFMQENRSFDHYFGHLRGVRGYNDRFPIPLPDGRPVWFQPRAEAPDQAVLPFHLDTATTNAQCLKGLDHSWTKSHAAIDAGRYGQWAIAKTGMTMGYYLRSDLPFHYALADAFTVCDQYFCSVPGQTHPNRFYLMTGMVDPTGSGGGPILDNNDIVDDRKLPPFTWTTYPERLQAAGISWQVYQQGLDFDELEGNFGTNILANFKQYIEAPPGSPLHQRAMSVRRLETLAEDVKADRLPQVSWILPPAAFSEHPRFTLAYGADFIARILDALTGNPAVWSKTVLLIMYDENDGLFDHVVPPQPPTPVLPGKSTVTTAGEIHDLVNPAHLPPYIADQLPYGLGPRVPMIAVSPWSKGGFVCSQVFDHTSVIRFIEARFGVMEPNITPWRRAVCGDLTSAFDFAGPPDAGRPVLPDTSGYRAMADAQSAIPIAPSVPGSFSGITPQEPGIRLARPLPYALQVDGRRAEVGFIIRFRNTGRQGTHFYVYSASHPGGPWRYTVEAGKELTESWATGTQGVDLSVYGPNGFFRRFGEPAAGRTLTVRAESDSKTGELWLHVANQTGAAIDCLVEDNAYGRDPRQHRLAAGQSLVDRWVLDYSHHWYDLGVTLAQEPGWSRRIAGHVETGRVGISDPAAIEPVLALAAPGHAAGSE